MRRTTIHWAVILGLKKTLQRIIDRFYWPGFSRAVKDFVLQCFVCQKRRDPLHHPKAQIQSIPIGGPFEMIAMDFLELPITPRKNRYVLVVSDYYTRWPEAFAVTSRNRGPDRHGEYSRSPCCGTNSIQIKGRTSSHQGSM